MKGYLDKINKLLTKIKLIRSYIHHLKIEKELKIKQIMTKKLIIKEKIGLLTKMKQKQ